MRNLTVILIAGIAVSAGCTDRQQSPSIVPSTGQRLIMSEGSASSDGLTVSDGNVVVIDNQPGIAFATVTTPGESKRVAYFVIFNHDRPDVGVKSASGSSGSDASTFHTINTYGNECTIRYEVAPKSGPEAVDTETISVGDKEYDPSEGRVFLIDMKEDVPTVKQTNLDLPTKVPALGETEATQRFGGDALKAFRDANETVDEFCQSIESKEAGK